METPTPLTNAAIQQSNGQWSYVLARTARELERERNEAMEQNARIPRSGIALAELLVKHGVIQPAAIDDAEGYDGCDTLDRIHAAWEEMIHTNPAKP